jgi:hypothetical protein
VTPTLFDISVTPGQTWSSSVRVINPNTEDITVHLTPVELESRGEQGVSRFQPISSTSSNGTSLAHWFSFPDTSVVVPQQETVSIPFRVPVPEDAAPGGQYAAILISTRPPRDATSTTQVRTAQAVSALFFMRVEGEVVEQGQIRSFRPSSMLTSRPENEFFLRFENQGTVHLQPQGDITIYNMWGQKRGVIPINQASQFGKVLPESIREFRFTWEGAFSVVDIGRYRAEATVGYGNNNRAFTQQTAYFWVIPITGLAITLGSIIGFFLLFTWLVRIYVRRALALSGVSSTVPRKAARTYSTTGATTSHDLNLTKDAEKNSISDSLISPIFAAWRDINARLGATRTVRTRLKTLINLLVRYKLVVIAVFSVLLCVWFVSWFFGAVLQSERSFESRTVDHQNQVRDTTNSEQLYRDRLRRGEAELRAITVGSIATSSVTDANITIVNVSGTPGVAATLAQKLPPAVSEGVRVRAELDRTERRSVIVYNSEQIDIAQNLSSWLDGALLSVRPTGESTTSTSPITIYAGSDVVVAE